jgi:hypothetical protein
MGGISLRSVDSDQDGAPHSLQDGHRLPRCRIFARSIPMMDVVMLAIGFVFFALSIGYVYGCDRL